MSPDPGRRMVLALRVPDGSSLGALAPLLPTFLHFAATPTAVYGTVLLAAAIAYYLLQGAILRQSRLA